MAKRRKEFQPISSLMKEVIKENKLQKGIQALAVKEAWEKLMGKGVASYTQSVEIQRKTLVVKLSSSVLREELSYGKEKIVDMMNAELGDQLIEKLLLC